MAEGNSIRPIIQDSWFWLIVWVAIAAAGIFYQVRQNRTCAFGKDRYVEGWG